MIEFLAGKKNCEMVFLANATTWISHNQRRGRGVGGGSGRHGDP
jgi:hypothetical protein